MTLGGGSSMLVCSKHQDFLAGLAQVSFALNFPIWHILNPTTTACRFSNYAFLLLSVFQTA